MLDFTGADMRSRTADLLITNQLLYQMSYIGLIKCETGKVVPVNINFMVVCQDRIDRDSLIIEEPFGNIQSVSVHVLTTHYAEHEYSTVAR